MTAIDISPNQDVRTWSRMKMTAYYYMPVFKKQAALNLAVSAVVSLMAFTAYYFKLPSVLCGAIISFLCLLFWLAPMSLARRDDRIITTLMPATALERWGVIIIYFFIVTPAVILLPPLCLQLISNIFSLDVDMFRHLFINKTGGFVFGRLYMFDQLLPPVICLWGIKFFRNSRIIKTVITMGGAFLALMFASGVFGVTVSYRVIRDSGLSDDTTEVPDVIAKEIGNRIVENFQPFYDALGIASLIVFAVMLWLIYRTIKKKQI